MRSPLDVVITNKAADQAALALGMNRDRARAWLEETKQGGTITDRLPAPHSGRRSPSGFFLLVKGVLVLPLAQDRDGSGAWIATGCIFFPAWLRGRGLGTETPDPLTLRGAALADQIRLSAHAVQRFQQRADAHRDVRTAEEQLRQALSQDARAVRKRPEWYRSQTPDDFYVIAGDGEYCLPMRRHASDGRPFEATTFLHQATRLFELAPADLVGLCHFTPAALHDAEALAGAARQPGPWLAAQIAATGRLSWQPPRGHRRHPQARFYLHAGQVLLPVDWDKQARPPLIVLAVDRLRLSLTARLIAWFRRRLMPRRT
jgi:hypothetical protein